MKTIKIMLAAFAVSFAGASFSQEVQDFELFNRVQAVVAEKGDLSFVEKDLAVAEQYLLQLCATNKVIYDNNGNHRKFVKPSPFVLSVKLAQAKATDLERSAEIDRWDESFSDSGVLLNPWLLGNGAVRFEKSCLKYCEVAAGGTNKFPVTVALMARNHGKKGLDKWPWPDRINFLAEKMAVGQEKVSKFDSDFSSILKDVVLPVKKYLRKNGKSFVVGDDGKNPVQDLIDELIAAFESPFLSGVKEWVEKIDPEYGWVDLVPAVSENDIGALRDAVFYGETALSERKACLLRYGLGHAGYNEFIESYNGDSK